MSGLRTLRSYLDLEEAIVVCSRLRAEGFDVALENEQLLNTNPALRYALQNRVVAREAELAAADAFLLELEKDARISRDHISTCEECGGVMRRERSVLWAAIGFFYGVPYAHETGAVICCKCGTKFASEGFGSRRLGILIIGVVLLAFLIWSGHIWRLGPLL
jgi:hypothetical protein